MPRRDDLFRDLRGLVDALETEELQRLSDPYPVRGPHLDPLGRYGLPEDLPVSARPVLRRNRFTGEVELTFEHIIPRNRIDLVSIGGGKEDPTATDRNRDLIEVEEQKDRERAREDADRHEREARQKQHDEANARRLQEARQKSEERREEERRQAAEQREIAARQRAEADALADNIDEGEAGAREEARYTRLLASASQNERHAEKLESQANLREAAELHREYISAVARQTLSSRGREFVITSGYRNEISDGFAPHARGAIDYRSKDLSYEDRHTEAMELSKQLGSS